ncbi:hypothetical protein ACPXB5_20755 [Micromonospora arida]|uniref:hypothetical protein n=1 Tax=Micromonospora arida TaxID=2203715 RepID=UPI003CE708B4
MPRSLMIHADYQAADLTRWERGTARLNGRIDGALGVHCPLPGHSRALRFRASSASLGRTAPEASGRLPEEAWTPFIGSVHDTAHATSSQMMTWLLATNRKLAVRLYRRAGTVVREHDRPEVISAGAAGRFEATLTEWRIRLHEARAAATAAGNHADLVVDTYWTALLRSHRRRHPDAYRCDHLRPPRVQLDPAWNKPDLFLLLRFTPDGADDEASARAGRVLRRALELLAGRTDDNPHH